MQECSSASICGNLDRHADEKKEVQELGKRKLKAEGGLKALKADLSIKQTLSKNVSQSFEARIHDALIRTNPQKYLTENNRPKEGVILADTYILKKYYGGRIPDNESVDAESELFQTIIQSHEEKTMTTRPKNSVINELQIRGITWPAHNTPPEPYPGYQFYNPAVWSQQPAGFGQQFMFRMPTAAGCYPLLPNNDDRHPLASPPPPPPLPDEEPYQESDSSAK